MAAEGWIRAADRDREETVEILQQAYAEGRLDPAELDERTETAFSARTIGELRALIADIPHRSSVAPLPADQTWRPGVPRRSQRPARQSLAMTLIMLLAAVACVMIGAATRDTAVIALALPAGFGAAILHRH